MIVPNYSTLPMVYHAGADVGPANIHQSVLCSIANIDLFCPRISKLKMEQGFDSVLLA